MYRARQLQKGLMSTVQRALCTIQSLNLFSNGNRLASLVPIIHHTLLVIVACQFALKLIDVLVFFRERESEIGNELMSIENNSNFPNHHAPTHRDYHICD